MWVIRRHRSCNIGIVILLTLLTIYIYVSHFDTLLGPKIIYQFLNQSTNSSSSSSLNLDYLNVRLDLTTSNARCNIDDILIIYVLSTVNNIRRRQVIRSTWASKQNRTCFVFIVGQVSGMFTGGGMIQQQINAEQKQYQDIVQIEHIESYANVVYKEIAALIWAKQFYPDIPFLFKTDDDLIVDTLIVSSLAQILITNVTLKESVVSRYRPILGRNLEASNRKTFFRGGWAMDYQPTLRGGGKFGVPEEVWPHPVLPAYCSGFGWLMSSYIRDQLVQASYTYPKKKAAWIGDVFVSGFLAKAANVKCTGLEIDFDQTASANCSCLMVNNPLLTVCSSTFHTGGGGTEEQRYVEYQRAWRVIQLRHNATHSVIENC